MCSLMYLLLLSWLRYQRWTYIVFKAKRPNTIQLVFKLEPFSVPCSLPYCFIMLTIYLNGLASLGLWVNHLIGGQIDEIQE